MSDIDFNDSSIFHVYNKLLFSEVPYFDDEVAVLINQSLRVYLKCFLRLMIRHRTNAYKLHYIEDISKEGTIGSIQSSLCPPKPRVITAKDMLLCLKENPQLVPVRWTYVKLLERVEQKVLKKEKEEISELSSRSKKLKKQEKEGSSELSSSSKKSTNQEKEGSSELFSNSKKSTNQEKEGFSECSSSSKKSTNQPLKRSKN